MVQKNCLLPTCFVSNELLFLTLFMMNKNLHSSFISYRPKYHDFREGHLPLKGDAEGLLAQLHTFACLPRPEDNKNEFPNLMFVTSFNEWWEGCE